MKVKMKHKRQAAPVAGPCQHCGQHTHERSCIAELKRQIAELRDQLARAQPPAVEPTVPPELSEVPVA